MKSIIGKTEENKLGTFMEEFIRVRWHTGGEEERIVWISVEMWKAVKVFLLLFLFAV